MQLKYSAIEEQLTTEIRFGVLGILTYGSLNTFTLKNVVLDGEITFVDAARRPVFRDLLFRRRQLSSSRLTSSISTEKTCAHCRSSSVGSVEETPQRKRSRIVYLDHLEGDGRLLFEQISSTFVQTPKSAGSMRVFSRISRRQLGHSAGCSKT